MQRWSLAASLKWTGAQPLSKQCPPWKTELPTSFFSYPSFIAEHGIIGYGLSFWPGGVVHPGRVLSQPLAHPWPALEGTE